MNTSNYDFENFYHYFRGAWVINPLDGERMQIDHTDSLAGVPQIILRSGSKASAVPFEKFQWKHISLPEELGFRNCGKFPYFFTMKVQRITHKGLSERTTLIKTVPQVEYCLAQISSNERVRYRQGAVLNSNSIRAVTCPKFPSLEQAVSNIKGKDVIGLALSPSVVVSISDKKDRNFDLIFNGAVAATSVDGAQWKPYSEDLIDPVSRSIGKLDYVN
jgi:hypothetical protein